jgi:proteasome accessory factor A
MGLETEYGLTLQPGGAGSAGDAGGSGGAGGAAHAGGAGGAGDAGGASGGQSGGPAGAVYLASLLVAGYKRAHPGFAPWDYGSEDPLQDARGFHLHTAGGDLVTNSATARAAAARRAGPGAALLVNGARLYVDHAHPEYSTPEVLGPAYAALWDKAGELVMARAVEAVARFDGVELAPYKNNTDGKGASYGTHENYLVARSVPWDDLVRAVTPFLVTRTVFTGSGRVGLGQRTDAAGFQLSQRADFVEAQVGLETTLNRPIVNTRDEPHADPGRWRRLHVIVGDATMMDVATYLRCGTMALVLRALEAGALDAGFVAGVALAHPVEAFQQVSRDLTLGSRLELANGGWATALEIQQSYLEAFQRAGIADAGAYAGAWAGGQGDGWQGDVARRWEAVLEALGTDPMTAGGQVEWVAKYRLLEGLRQRSGIGWDHPKLRAADLQWTDVRPAHSLFAKVAAAGAVETLFDQAQVEWAAMNPPANTRAWAKGQAIGRLGEGVLAGGWDSITLDRDGTPVRIALPDPLDGSALEALIQE